MNKTFRNILGISIIIIILVMGAFMGTTNSKEIGKDLTNNLANNGTNKSVTIELERPPFLDDLEGDAP